MKRQTGFTLIELVITVGIVGILASVAIPSYTAYVQRGRVAAATQLLAAQKVAMEQFYASNRTYFGAPACINKATEDGSFFVGCNPALVAGAQTFILQAVDTTNAYTYTINEANVKRSVTPWAGTQNCWILKKGATC